MTTTKRTKVVIQSEISYLDSIRAEVMKQIMAAPDPFTRARLQADLDNMNRRLDELTQEYMKAN